MKNNRSFVLICWISCLLFSIACEKKKLPSETLPASERESGSNLEAVFSSPDMEKLRDTVKNARKLNGEIVVAITVLHRDYISNLENQMFDHNTSRSQKEKIFEEQKNLFFNTLPFSYEEYTKYIEEHPDEVNAYIVQHPELLDYLSTENKGM